MQQLHAEAEREARYDLETVKRAAALAVKLQEGQRNSLSQADVDAMAAEAGIDPACMRQALSAVRQEQARATGCWLTKTSRGSRVAMALVAGAALGVALLVPGVYLMSAAPATEPAHVSPAPPVAVTEVMRLPADGVPLKNGSLTAPASLQNGTQLSAGSTAVPAWKVISGQARYLRLPGTSYGAVALESNAWLEQLVPTIPGATYRLTYEIGGEAGPEARLHRMTVKAIQPNHGETSQEASVFTDAGAAGPSGWASHQMNFRAQDVAARIDFGNSQPADGTSLPVLRNVHIERTSSAQTP